MKTSEDAVRVIVKSSADPKVVADRLQMAFDHGYTRGYNAGQSDMRSSTRGKESARKKDFKNELDMIDDVIKAKWA